MKKLDLWRRRAPDPAVPPAAAGCDAADPSAAAAPVRQVALGLDGLPLEDEEDTVPAAFYHQPD